MEIYHSGATENIMGIRILTPYKNGEINGVGITESWGGKEDYTIRASYVDSKLHGVKKLFKGRGNSKKLILSLMYNDEKVISATCENGKKISQQIWEEIKKGIIPNPTNKNLCK